MPVKPYLVARCTKSKAFLPLHAISTAQPLVCGPSNPVELTAALCFEQRYHEVIFIGREYSSRRACRRSRNSGTIIFAWQCLQAISSSEKFFHRHSVMQCLAPAN